MSTFVENTKKSFARAKEDADGIRKDMSELKDNLTEWLTYFENRENEMQKKIDNLQKRVADLEAEKIRRTMDEERLFSF